MKPARSRRGTPAFMRVDLLVIGLLLLLLAAIGRPAWGNAQASRSLVCMDNQRRLATAWMMYADENGGRFVVSGTAGNSGWVSGVLDWSTTPDNTNTAYLTDPRRALLAPYGGQDATIFRCPADVYLSPVQTARGWKARVRSYAQNYFVAVGSASPFYPNYVNYTRRSDLLKLAPAQVLLMIEEHPDSINDGLFIAAASTRQWMDLPASHHDGAAWFSFADGHVELHAWQSPRTVVPVRYQYTPPTLPANDPDFAWVTARTSEPR